MRQSDGQSNVQSEKSDENVKKPLGVGAPTRPQNVSTMRIKIVRQYNAN